ncbi:MMPL family transporter [Streptomyces sp. Ncost-T10-10d]|uniref:MMPL family transporter n=1 Tax=Streptomyces sp. Ncost-T10-10d TaxID=1839774 RepID=UPI00081E56F8|nr:MMPL family transporter [Streptomyces sp. Ncost-T10-10d]SCF56744.1 putative drug exporter of the RND superfamily [Streptomyces sp. Ncost-T10-10d]
MASLLYRLGRGAFRHRRAVLAAWLLVLTAVVTCVITFGGTTNDEFTVPGSPAQTAMDTLKNELPSAADTSAQIVFAAPEGHHITEPQYVRAVSTTMAEADKAPQVVGVTDPVQSKVISPDRTAALGQVRYQVSRADLHDDSLTSLEKTTRPAKDAGLTVEVGGSAYGSGKSTGHTKELLGVAVALVVLTITFGSLFAAGMPLLTAITGVAVTLLGLSALTGVLTISSTAPSLASMLGLAVGIDYALFVLSRHRSQLATGMDTEESAARATATAGSAVVFAGLTVIIALCGLAVVRIPFLTVMGVGGAAAVFIAVGISTTLLPALMGFAGERLRPRPGSRAARREQAAHGSGQHGGHGARRTMGERWGRIAIRRPLLTLLAVLIGLLAVAVPARDLQLALPDNSSAPAGSSQRQAYDLVSEKFGPGFNGPLLVLADTSHAGNSQAATATLVKDLKTTDGVASVGEPQVIDHGEATVIQVVPKTGPSDQKTKDLVQYIRHEATGWQKQTGSEVSVTGTTAVNIDVSDRLASSLIPFALVVVGLSLLLLLLVFRSVVVPLKASLGFLLSVAATFGAVVAVFQWGWLASALSVTETGPVVSILPILVMAVLFGLAMDYEVFMVSRMREAHVHGAAPREAVLAGSCHASRVVTAAALIMFAVFASFVPGGSTMLKPIAFALAVGVFIDAFLVRMTLVPAVLALVGRAGWWLPKWLDRLLPDLDIEGERLSADRQKKGTDGHGPGLPVTVGGAFREDPR